jgi:chromosome segregation ATPase
VAIATKFAATAASGGGGVVAAQQALQVANQFAFGTAAGSSPTLGNKNVPQLHSAVLARLKTLQQDTKTQQAKLRNDLQTQQTADDAAKAAVTMKQSILDPLLKKKQARDESLAKADAAKATQNSLSKSIEDKKQQIATAPPGTNVDALNSQIDALNKEVTRQSTIESDARAAAGDADPTLAPAQAALDDATKQRDAADKALKQTSDALQNLGLKTAATLTEILQSHAGIIDALQSAVAKDQPGGPKPELQDALNAAQNKK